MEGDRLEFDVLGGLEVRRGESTVSLTSARQRTLLAALLVHAARPAPADHLIEAVWGESLPMDPRASLNTLLSRLRVVLGDQAIESGPTGYRLIHHPEGADASRFEDLIRRARDMPTSEALETLDEALSLWRGPAYAEFADLGFASAEAGRLDQLRNTSIEDRAELLLESGDHESAVAALEGHVTENPMSERGLALLMTGLYRLGRHSESLQRFADYRRMLVQEMGLDPSPDLMGLELAILNHDLPIQSDSPGRREAPSSWMARDDAFVGREDEIGQLTELVEGHRLVSVTGMAGVGKTRLVAESLATLTEPTRRAVTVVELSSVDSDQIGPTIAAALGIGPISGDVLEATLEYLAVTPMLLVLDNCEHVIVPVSRFLRSALGRCPNLSVLTTSRRPIGLPSEQVLPIEPLPVPDMDDFPDTAAGTAAIRLFVARARQIRPTFLLDGREVPAAVSICRRLDGLPLGIELAAARAARLGVDIVAARLEGSLDLIAGRQGDDGRSLRTALEWSIALLDEAEQELLSTLSVFEGLFDLRAAEEVATIVSGRYLADGLVALVEASLVSVGTKIEGVHHYRLLGIVRELARERLQESGRADEVHLAHSRWVRTLMESAAETALGPDDVSLPGRLDTLTPDIRAAITWALETGEVELAGDIAGHLVLAESNWQPSLELIPLVRRVADAPGLEGALAAPLARGAAGYVAVLTGDLEGGERTARDALSKAASTDARYLALLTLGIVSLYSGRHHDSRRWWTELLALEDLPPACLSDGYASLALVDIYTGDREAARRHLARAAAAAEASGSHAQHCFVRYVEGELAVSSDLEAAVPLLESAAREADRVGADFRSGLAFTALAAAYTRLGRTSEAIPVFAHLLDLWLRLAVRPQLWTTLRLLAELLSTSQRPESAALLLLAADHADDAPAVTGDDEHRYATLDSGLRSQIDSYLWEELAELATMLPRTSVVERARDALQDVQQGLQAAGGEPDN